MAINPIMYNAVLAGVTGGNQQRWAATQSQPVPSAFLTDIAVIIADAVDAVTGIRFYHLTNPSEAKLIRAICQGEFIRYRQRLPTIDRAVFNADYLPAIVQSIDAAYVHMRVALEYVPIPFTLPNGPQSVNGAISQQQLDSVIEALVTSGLIGDNR